MENRAGGAIAPWACVAFAFVFAPARPGAASPAIAFYYGDSPDVSALEQFPRVVLEPDHLTAAGLSDLQHHGSEVFAYLSVGEANRSRTVPGEVNRAWILGEDAAWNSVVMDPAQAGWRQALLDRMGVLYRHGYRGFFLDTLDAWRCCVRNRTAEAARVQGLVQLIRTAHEKFPGSHLLLNRGFELLPEVHTIVSGVVAESLFSGWNPTTRQYVEVSREDREWLLKRLLDAQHAYGLDAIAVDYVPLEERERARAVAARIHALGIVPWVAPFDLGALGVGELELIPRRVVALYDGQAEGDWRQSRIHRFVQMPLEYEGYVVDPIDISGGLPRPLRRDAVAGLVTWFSGELPASFRYAEWLRRTLAGGVHVAAFGVSGTTDSEALEILGLQRAAAPVPPVTVAAASPLTGLEARPSVESTGIGFWRAVGKQDVSHFVLSDSRRTKLDAVITGPWGGFAADPELLEPGYAGRQRWILDPFAFLRAAFQEPLPLVPDVTTESGRRILIVAVSGDGQTVRADRPGQPAAAAVVLDDLLRRGLPFSVADPSGRSSPLVETASALGAGHLPILEDAPSLTNVSPLGLPGGAGFTAYAPGESAEDGTAIGSAYALDAGPIIARLNTTGRPRRLKPVGITLRPGIVVEPAGQKTLDTVLDWIRSQSVTPLWTSEYVARAEQFRRVVLLRDVEGGWHLRNAGELRTLRMDGGSGWPDIAGSSGVAGVNDGPEGRYVIIGSATEPVVRIRRRVPSGTWLASANGVVDSWSAGADGVTLALHGHVPLQLTVWSQARQCRLTEAAEFWTGRRTGNIHTFALHHTSLRDATLRCH